jgi:long-chain acyl-CoA synthetase
MLGESHAFAAELGEAGVKPGDRVGLWLKNCPEFVPALFGILQSAAVAVPINCFLKTDEVNFIIGDAGIDVLITDVELGTHHRGLTSARPNLRILHVEDFAGKTHAEIRAPERSEADLAVLIYTSGTTGKPKGAMLSHGNLLHNVESCRIVLQTVEGDRIAVLLPLFHSYMLTVGLLLL